MKVIFLDHDGVMATQNDFAIPRDNEFDSCPFSRRCVYHLNRIIEATDAEIVVSSDWRNSMSIGLMRKWYTVNGVCKKPIGYTPNSPLYNMSGLERGRADEIAQWVRLHSPESWVAVDDLNMSQWLGGGFVFCLKQYEGIRQLGVPEKVLSALSVPRPAPSVDTP